MVSALLNRGSILAELGRFDEAQASFDELFSRLVPDLAKDRWMIHAKAQSAALYLAMAGKGKEALARADEAQQKPPVTAELLARGRERYEIYCSPCHDRVGHGNGIVVQRGMPKPPSLHDERLRADDDQHLFDVITRGYGVMYSHADRVRPGDRWAIVAYIRTLQASQNPNGNGMKPSTTTTPAAGATPTTAASPGTAPAATATPKPAGSPAKPKQGGTR